MAHRVPWIGYSILKCVVIQKFPLYRNVLVLF